MEAYSDFATVYDTFMDETPYEIWGDYVDGLIQKYGVSKAYSCEDVGSAENSGDLNSDDVDIQEALNEERNLVVELGCGTGSFTQIMKKKGYDIMGIDMSSDMLNIARNKAVKEGLDIMYLEQDMRELDLYCTAGTIVSVCDSVNYLLEDDDVIETFKLVNNFLFPKGVFIFDFNTLHKYRDVIGDATIAENRDDCSFIWDNYYHEDEHINEYDLTIFVREGAGKSAGDGAESAENGEDEADHDVIEDATTEEYDVNDGGLFRRFSETHYQRGYTLDEMKSFVKAAGMELVTVIDADTHEEPTEDSERIYVVARECGK
ncbi:class I SAM-dependent DNA methyltransferase [Butyrivibrio proteoclasticus]|uniref:class I SAM-dependent DNA methyltransferase n=1 Tax=Butyrivibrio proteoclasticus TaxID=43305 RepID=UPI00047E8A8B|nr:class I SAM-dependent methyltransferase [Butyrivibrio proteoclasticus]